MLTIVDFELVNVSWDTFSILLQYKKKTKQGLLILKVFDFACINFPKTPKNSNSRVFNC